MGRDRGRAADDKRRPRFVDQDRVYFVDNRVMITALDLLFACGGHTVVAQVIEAELAVRSVRDVAGVLLTTNIRFLIMLDAADRQPQEIVERTHPFGVAAGEVIIHRYEMRAASSESIQVQRQSRDQG